MQEPSPEVHGLAVIIGLLEVASELSKVPVSMRIDWNRQCSDKIPIAFWIHHRLDQSWSMLLVWPGSGWGAWGVCHVINMHQNPPELHNTTPPELHNANTELSLRCAPPEFEALPADPQHNIENPWTNRICRITSFGVDVFQFPSTSPNVHWRELAIELALSNALRIRVPLAIAHTVAAMAGPSVRIRTRIVRHPATKKQNKRRWSSE